jgi:hypothetical protein
MRVMVMSNLHPAIHEELDMLRARFPGKQELTLDDYADYFGIDRHYACQHFQRVNAGRLKINHKRIGRLIIIPMLDMAYWLAQHKVVNGKKLVLPSSDEVKQSMKTRRGFNSAPKYDYRALG